MAVLGTGLRQGAGRVLRTQGRCLAPFAARSGGSGLGGLGRLHADFTALRHQPFCTDADKGDAGGSSPSSGSEGHTFKAKQIWRATVEGQDLLERMPEKSKPRGAIYNWLSTKAALHHARHMAPDEEERFSTLEADLLEGSKQCLHFLADSIGGGRSDNQSKALEPPFLDENLGERLQAEVKWLEEAGYDWRWQVESLEAEIQRIFVILGTRRGGTIPRERHFLNAFGQQFVLTPEQAERFLSREGGFNARITVFQDLLFSDMVLVADVAVSAKQRSKLVEGSEPDLQLDDALVEHVLRLEMPMSHDRTTGHDVPHMRASPWQLVDWNWVCLGNHPSLPPNVPAPW